MSGWIGVDLDGTLAKYDHWRGPEHIGAPVPAMRVRVIRWLAEGRDVRIFTARITDGRPEVTRAIEKWCVKNLGRKLPITATKDYGCVEYWDDRAVQVEPNTGRRVDGQEG